MKLSRITVKGCKGINADVVITRPHVLLSGPMGSGKSAIMDAVHIAMGLPTRYGSTGLDRLSPTGTWSVALEFGDGGKIRSIERTIGAKSTLAVNGIKTDRADYDSAVAQVLAVDPHHVSLGAFLSLSGQARAAMFSRMLEDSATVTVADMVRAAAGELSPLIATRWGPDGLAACQPLLTAVGRIAGTHSEIVEALKAIANTESQGVRDAKGRVDNMVSSQPRVSHSHSRAELQERLSAVDHDLGAIRNRRLTLDGERERFLSAQKMLDAANAAEALAKQTRDERLEAAGKIPKMRQSHQDRTDAANALAEKLLALKNAARDAEAGASAAVSAHKQVQADYVLVKQISARSWVVDREWLAEETWTALESSFGLEGSDLTDAQAAAIVALAKEVFQETMGGDVQRLQEKIAQLDKQRAELASAATEANKKVKAAEVEWKSADAAARAAMMELSGVTTLASSVDEAELTLSTVAKQRLELEQGVGKLAITEDEEVIGAQEQERMVRREEIVAQMRELEAVSALSGQVERLRLDVAEGATRVEVAKWIMETCQLYRDRVVQDRVRSLMEPFRAAFVKMFGPGVELRHEASGTGRSTQFEFQLCRGLQRVPFDLLSDGESAMAACAFLDALQALKPGPGRFLTIPGEALDRVGLSRVLEGVPKLGFETVLLASNWGWYLRETCASQLKEWQVVDMPGS